MSWVEKNWKPLTIVGGLLGLSWFAGKRFEGAEKPTQELRDYEETFDAERIKWDYVVHREPKGTKIGKDGKRIPNPKGGWFKSVKDAETFEAPYGRMPAWRRGKRQWNKNHLVWASDSKAVREAIKTAFPEQKFSVRIVNGEYIEVVAKSGTRPADIEQFKEDVERVAMTVLGEIYKDSPEELRVKSVYVQAYERDFGAETFNAELEDCYVCDGMFKQVYVCDNDCGFQCCEMDIDGNLIPVENADGTVKDYCITCYEENYGAEEDEDDGMMVKEVRLRIDEEGTQFTPTWAIEKKIPILYHYDDSSDLEGIVEDMAENAEDYAIDHNENYRYSAETFDAEGVWRWDYDPMMQSRIDNNNCKHRYDDGEDAWIMKYSELMGVQDGLSYIEAGVKCGICGQERIGSWGINEREGFQITKGEEGRMPRFYGYYGAETFEAPIMPFNRSGRPCPSCRSWSQSFIGGVCSRCANERSE